MNNLSLNPSSIPPSFTSSEPPPSASSLSVLDASIVEVAARALTPPLFALDMNPFPSNGMSSSQPDGWEDFDAMLSGEHPLSSLFPPAADKLNESIDLDAWEELDAILSGARPADNSSGMPENPPDSLPVLLDGAMDFGGDFPANLSDGEDPYHPLNSPAQPKKRKPSDKAHSSSGRKRVQLEYPALERKFHEYMAYLDISFPEGKAVVPDKYKNLAFYNVAHKVQEIYIKKQKYSWYASPANTKKIMSKQVRADLTKDRRINTSEEQVAVNLFDSFVEWSLIKMDSGYSLKTNGSATGIFKLFDICSSILDSYTIIRSKNLKQFEKGIVHLAREILNEMKDIRNIKNIFSKHPQEDRHALCCKVLEKIVELKDLPNGLNFHQKPGYWLNLLKDDRLTNESSGRLENSLDSLPIRPDGTVNFEAAASFLPIPRTFVPLTAPTAPREPIFPCFHSAAPLPYPPPPMGIDYPLPSALSLPALIDLSDPTFAYPPAPLSTAAAVPVFAAGTLDSPPPQNDQSVALGEIDIWGEFDAMPHGDRLADNPSSEMPHQLVDGAGAKTIKKRTFSYVSENSPKPTEVRKQQKLEISYPGIFYEFMNLLGISLIDGKPNVPDKYKNLGISKFLDVIQKSYDRKREIESDYLVDLSKVRCAQKDMLHECKAISPEEKLVFCLFNSFIELFLTEMQVKRKVSSGCHKYIRVSSDFLEGYGSARGAELNRFVDAVDYLAKKILWEMSNLETDKRYMPGITSLSIDLKRILDEINKSKASFSASS